MAAKQKKVKILPGYDPSDKGSKLRSARLCSAFLRGEKVDLPSNMSKGELAEFCAKNRVGRPFAKGMLGGGLKAFCQGAKSVKACREKVLESSRTAVGTSFRLNKVIARSTPLITTTLKGKPLTPAATASKTPCRAPGKHNAKKGMRECHYELEFFTDSQAQAKGLARGGPHLRICGKKTGQNGALYPVDSPEQADALMKKHCGCKKSGGKSCIPDKPAAFGGVKGLGGRVRAGRNRYGLYGYGKR
ncbi:MAG: hypothetical protein WC729_29570 [Sphingomonas sp.]|jgi:hypothetical protein|uniref:hypothetical protein n=1 Tax=Sphingomonas sp. TaxID=28214 RepID=UPI00356A9FF4